ncbi:MAG: carboxylating nicotinate-nucleotide diphosphorylase [bacterium]|nr:carboxylating nicotinate-nucleotide diphosphorylase [bacterium]
MSKELNFPDENWISTLVKQSLEEDIKTGDVTTDVTVNQEVSATGFITAREAGFVAGLPLVSKIYNELDSEVCVKLLVADGQRVEAGQEIVSLSGKAASLLTGERTVLNFLQHLSGIASLTAKYVEQVSGTDCMVLDTRKTLPGYRALAKYAVRCGGGNNHRMGLYDRILMKDNHWASKDLSLAELVEIGRQKYPELAIEIEVDTMEQLAEILPLKIDWILLDNFTHKQVAEAISLRNTLEPDSWKTKFEASGNVNLETVNGYARAGVDAVSVGRLTHSVIAMDIGLDFSAGDSDD